MVTFTNQSNPDLILLVKEKLTNNKSDFLDIEKLFLCAFGNLSRFNTVFDENNETHTINIFVHNLISAFLSLYFRRRYSLINIIM